MNKLITTNNGGFPLVLDDLRFLDEAYRDAFKHIIQGFIPDIDVNNSALILKGCERTTVGIFPEIITTYNPGIVAINGEICVFDGLIEGIGPVRSWSLKADLDPSGTKVFKNGDSNTVYQLRTAELIIDLGSPTPLNYSLSKRLSTEIANTVKSFSTTWQLLPGSLMQGSFAEGQVSFMRDALGFVHLRGIWHSTFLETNQLLGTLPLGFRPQLQRNYRLDAASETITGNCLVRINTNGEIRVVGTATEEIRLNQIPPFLAVL
jgi:hypothetical protein